MVDRAIEIATTADRNKSILRGVSGMFEYQYYLVSSGEGGSDCFPILLKRCLVLPLLLGERPNVYPPKHAPLDQLIPLYPLDHLINFERTVKRGDNEKR